MPKIVLCETCKGTGKIEFDVGTHNSEYETHTCPFCNGTGRQMVMNYTYYFPMITNDNDMSTYYKIDSTIHEILRAFVAKIKENQENQN